MKDTQEAGTNQRMSQSRYSELKQMLQARRREIQAEVQGKMRGVREEGTWGGKLNEINDALVRLEQGDYGYCFDCGEEIAEKRLRALPFAVRCKDCEEARENAEQRQRQLSARRGTGSLFADM